MNINENQKLRNTIRQTQLWLCHLENEVASELHKLTADTHNKSVGGFYSMTTGLSSIIKEN